MFEYLSLVIIFAIKIKIINDLLITKLVKYLRQMSFKLYNIFSSITYDFDDQDISGSSKD
jgi:hypothetical protein